MLNYTLCTPTPSVHMKVCKKRIQFYHRHIKNLHLVQKRHCNANKFAHPELEFFINRSSSKLSINTRVKSNGEYIIVLEEGGGEDTKRQEVEKRRVAIMYSKS